MSSSINKPPKSSPKKKRLQIWHMVTNHQNMLYMLAAGMAMSPAGFRGKHYADTLDTYKGWVPLFRQTELIPASAMAYVTSERKHLLPCIASFDVTSLGGAVQMLSYAGHRRTIPSTVASSRKNNNETTLLARSPLPISLLCTLTFRSAEDEETFRTLAQSLANVDLSSILITVDASAFVGDEKSIWPPAGIQNSLSALSDDTIPAFGQAVGGVLTMLYYLAHRSNIGLAAFRMATGSAHSQDIVLMEQDSILAELGNWIATGNIHEEADTRAHLFWGVAQSLVTAQMHGCAQSPIDVVLAYIESQLQQLRDTKEGPYLERLSADMRSMLGFGSSTITMLFENHKGLLSRSLLLFCLRERCADLLEFSHPLLGDTDYIVAGILFGIRDGWLRLPKELRHQTLAHYVPCAMTKAEHKVHGNAFSLEEAPRPKPLREYFMTADGDWNDDNTSLALDLVNAYGWYDCLQTRITLAANESALPDKFICAGTEIVVPCKVAKTTEEVHTGNFLRRLGQWPPVSLPLTEEKKTKRKRSSV